MWGHTAIVKYLLEQGADINACNEKGYAAIHWAIKQSGEEIFNVLMDHPKLDPSSTTEHQLNSLHLLCSLQTSTVAGPLGGNTIVEPTPSDSHSIRGSLVRIKTSKSSEMFQVRKRMMQRLIAKGVPVNGRTQQRRLPLHFCVERLGLEHVEVLLNAGSEIDLAAIGKTPLMIACLLSKQDIALLLLERGANFAFSSVAQGDILSISATNNLIKVVDAIMVANTDDFTTISRPKFISSGLLKALEFAHAELALRLANYIGQMKMNGKSHADTVLYVLDRSVVITSLDIDGASSATFTDPAAPATSPPTQPTFEIAIYRLLGFLSNVLRLNKPRLTTITATLAEKIQVVPEPPLMQLFKDLENNYNVTMFSIYSMSPGSWRTSKVLTFSLQSLGPTDLKSK